MKRFVSYILLCVSFMIGMFAGFVPSVVSMNASADFDNGKNFIYQISLKENSEMTQADIDSGDAIKGIIETFKERLDAANVSTYNLEKEGNDSIRLSFKAQSEVNVAIAAYLNFDWNIQAMSFDGKIFLNNEDFFKSGDAYIDYSNSYPVIVLPLSNPEKFKSEMYDVVSQVTSEETDGNMNSQNLEGEEGETIPDGKYIYLVNNWNSESYSLDSVINDSSNSDSDELEAYIDRIEASSLSSVYFDYDGNDDKIFEKLIYTGFLNNANGDLATANRLATIICAKFNSTPLDYKVTLINRDYVNNEKNISNPFVEKLIKNGNQYGTYSSIVFSTLLIATIIAFVLVSLFTILNYGIGGLATISLTGTTFVSTLFLINLIGAEFNIGSVIALIGVVMVSLFTSICYHKNLNEELYKGKVLKKANAEASKQATGLQVDLSVATCIFGLVAYLIPSSILSSAGAILIIGGLINLILNCLVMKGFMHLLTNSSYINKHLNLLRVNTKLCPDLTKDEKPTYFDNFKNEINPKTNKKLKIGALVALIVSVAGILTFQLINGNIYNTNTSTVTSTRVYVEFDYNENSTIKSVSDLETKVLNNIYTFDNDVKADNHIKANDILTFDFTFRENYQVSKETSKKVYYVVEFASSVTNESKFCVSVDNSVVKYEPDDLVDAFNYLIKTENNCTNLNVVSVKSVTNVKSDSNNLYCLLFASIGCALVSIYMIFKYGISRAITSFAINFGSMVVVTGLFTLIRGPFTSQVTLGCVLMALVGYAILFNLYSKEKSLFKENKISKDDINGLKEVSTLANNLTNQNVIIVVLLCGFVLISFLFSNVFTTYFILYTLIGLALIMMYLGVVNDLVYFLKNKFSILFNNISRRIDERASKKESKDTNKKETGDGPEEALFIGIND